MPFFQTIFGSVKEPNESLCPSVCPCQSAIKVSQSSYLSLSVSQVRSLLGLFQVCFSSLLAYFVGQTGPKILRLVFM